MNGLHAAPVLQALRTSGSPALRVFDGAVDPKTVPPYVVVYLTVGTPESGSMEESWDRVEATAIVHSVGGNADAVRAIADRVWTALMGVRPVIAGRSCSRITLTDSQPARRDESTGQVVLDQVDVYQFVSSPG